MSLGLIQRRPVHPWVALREAERAIDRLNRRAAPVRRVAGPLRSFVPRLDAVETEKGFDITAEIPGVAREDLQVSVQEGLLTLKGVRRYGRQASSAGAIDVGQAADESTEARAGEGAGTAAQADARPNEEADANAVHFERQIRFNADVDEDAISARYSDGVLEVHVPKVTPPEPEVRTIPVEVG